MILDHDIDDEGTTIVVIAAKYWVGHFQFETIGRSNSRTYHPMEADFSFSLRFSPAIHLLNLPPTGNPLKFHTVNMFL
jgi:hypothetical protein